MQVLLKMVMATAWTLAATPALAQSAAVCAATAARVDDSRLVPARLSLADLSMAIPPDQAKTLTAARIEFLQGRCAGDVHAFQMGIIEFKDGATFAWQAKDERFVPWPTLSGRNFGTRARLGGAPVIAGASFVAATHVDGGPDAGVEVGLDQNGAGYLVVAFTNNATGYSAPVALFRSAQPIDSVTFFPAPDSNAGTLGVLARTDVGVVLVSLNWYHDALSRIIRPRRTSP